MLFFFLDFFPPFYNTAAFYLENYSNDYVTQIVVFRCGVLSKCVFFRAGDMSAGLFRRRGRVCGMWTREAAFPRRPHVG